MQNFFDKNQPSQQSNKVKYQHLAIENNNLYLTIKQLQSQIQSLRIINDELIKKSPNSIQMLIDVFSKQNGELEKSLFRLIKNNQELSCNILMKNQLICQAQRQFREIISNFEEKIYQLRVCIQNKEIVVTSIENKILQQKQQSYGATSRVNMMYFNQMNEIKAMLDRISIQNTQFKFLNAIKDDQIDKMKQLIQKYQKVLDTKQDLKKFKQNLTENTNQQTKSKKQIAKNKLQQQLTRFDMKYKNQSITKNSNTINQINNLKFMVTQLNKQNRDLKTQITKITKILAKKDRQYRIMQEAYKKISTEFVINKIEVQFYKQNFKELSKVSTERKIKYYDQYYQQILPNLQKQLHLKQNIINYWKHWEKNCQPIFSKAILSTKMKKGNHFRSNSCCASHRYKRDVSRKICTSKQKQLSIFSFINQTHTVDSMINHTIEIHNNPQNEEIFNDEISIIIRPKMGKK